MMMIQKLYHHHFILLIILLIIIVVVLGEKHKHGPKATDDNDGIEISEVITDIIEVEAIGI